MDKRAVDLAKIRAAAEAARLRRIASFAKPTTASSAKGFIKNVSSTAEWAAKDLPKAVGGIGKSIEETKGTIQAEVGRIGKSVEDTKSAIQAEYGATKKGLEEGFASFKKETGERLGKAEKDLHRKINIGLALVPVSAVAAGTAYAVANPYAMRLHRELKKLEDKTGVNIAGDVPQDPKDAFSAGFKAAIKELKKAR